MSSSLKPIGLTLNDESELLKYVYLIPIGLTLYDESEPLKSIYIMSDASTLYMKKKKTFELIKYKIKQSNLEDI